MSVAVKGLSCTFVAERCTSWVVCWTIRFGPLSRPVHITTGRRREKLRAALQFGIEHRPFERGRLAVAISWFAPDEVFRATARAVLGGFTASRTARNSEVVTVVVQQAAKKEAMSALSSRSHRR